MSTMQEDRYLTLEAGADFSAKQYYIMALDTSTGKAIVANAQTVPIVGVLENFPKSGDLARIVMPQVGTMKVKCGGTITPGAYVTADSAGKAIATTTGNDMVIGRYLGAANAVSGDVAEIELMFFRY